MRRPHRWTALAAALVMLQSMLLGSGALCAAPLLGGTSQRGMAGMAQMNMSRAPAPAPRSPRTPAHEQMPCHLPWAPAGCQTMAPCAPTALTSKMLVILSAPLVPHDVQRLELLAPPSISTPPELPPPRA